MSGITDERLAEVAVWDNGGMAWVGELARELQQKRAADRWIPVSERLPDDGQTVVVYRGGPNPPQDDYLRTMVAWLDCDSNPPDWVSGGESRDGVTHWRPLPAAPVTERKEPLSEKTATQVLRGRPVTHDEAAASADRLINSRFGQSNGARASIPARPDDDDIVIVDYILEQRASAGAVPVAEQPPEYPAPRDCPKCGSHDTAMSGRDDR